MDQTEDVRLSFLGCVPSLLYYGALRLHPRDCALPCACRLLQVWFPAKQAIYQSSYCTRRRPRLRVDYRPARVIRWNVARRRGVLLEPVGSDCFIRLSARHFGGQVSGQVSRNRAPPNHNERTNEPSGIRSILQATGRPV